MRKNIKDNKIKELILNQKGMALLTTLIFIFILVSFGVALLSMTSNDIKLSALQRDSTKAFYIAEAGIEKALWYLNTKDLGGKGFDWRTNNDADPNEYIQETYPTGSTNYYKVTVEDDTGTEDIIIITSRGVVYDGNKVYGNRKIEVKAIKGILQSPGVSYDYAIATETNMEIMGNLFIVGDIHSNGDISKVAGAAYTLDGVATAVGENPIGNHGVDYYDPLPQVDFDFYEELSKDPTYEGEFYDIDGATKYFNTDGQVITGIHFIVGNVEISANTHLIIEGGAIFATGTITSIGNAQITHTQREDNINEDCDTYSWDPGEPCYDPLYNNPLALIAKGDIILSGTVDVQGIIQTNGKFTSNGVITIDPGAVLADDGIFHGGGGKDVMNIVYGGYDFDWPVPGTGLPFYIIISWQEA